MLSQPYKYKQWLIWPDTVLDFLYISDCNDTINGVCLENQSLHQCIDQCNKTCGVGYYITDNTGKSICVPLRTDIHPLINQSYRLRNKNDYHELKDMYVSTFINTDIFPFPPDMGNVVFYQDILTLEDTVHKTTLGSKNDSIHAHNYIYFSKDADNNIQLIPSQASVTQITQYKPIKYGDEVQLTVPGTSLFMRTNIDNILVWESSSGIINRGEISFRLMPIDKNNKVGDIVTYGSKFAIIFIDDSVVVLDSEFNYLRLENNNLTDVLKNKKFISTFTLISKMKGYYCEEEVCKSIPIKDTITDGMKCRYKGKMVDRKKSCWNLCRKPKGKIIFWVIPIIVSVVILIILVIYILLSK